MQIEPIKILIDDNNKFAEIALFVDRKDFLLDIEKYRQELGIKNPMSRIDADKWMNDEIGKQVEHAEKVEPDLVLFPKTRFEVIIETLRLKYKKPRGFELLIQLALLCGEINDNNFATAYCAILDEKTPIEEPEIAIVISPYTSEKELLTVFKTETPLRIKEFQERYSREHKIIGDPKSEIKRHRHWYWLKRQMSWNKLCEQLKNEGEVITKSGVVNSVLRYRNCLETPI